MHVVDPELDSQESLDDNIVNSSVSSTTDDDSYSRNVHSLSSFNLQPRDGNYGKYKKQLDCNLRIGSAYYIGTTINPNFNLSTDEQHKTMKDDAVDKTARSQAFLRNPFNLLLAREQGDIGASSKSRRLRYRATRWITEGHQRYNGLQIYGNRCKGVLYPDAQTFQENIQGSLWAVNRLHLENKFECHHGCVNALNFNSRGNLIASGSDDLRVVITNWMTGEQMWNYRTGHSMNIFHVKFIPESNDLKIVSCACDSEVRLALLSPAGGLAGPTRLLAKHTRACHKLSIPEGEPNIVLSAGADGRVFSSDVRTSVAHKILHLAYSEFFSIASNPVRSHEFALCGRSESVVRIYDRRKVSRHDPKKGLLHTFGVDHLRANSRRRQSTTTTNAGGESQFSHRVTMNSRTSRRRHLSGDSDSDSDSDRNLLSSLTAQLGHGVRAVLSALGGRARAALLSGNTNDSSIPSNLADDFDLTMYSVTAAVYSPQGDAILLSYNDDDIYLFDVNHLDKPYLHKYSGHRNMQTIVGATFFGPNGEYIVSGSDDGYFYLWDRESEGVAQWLHADIGGAVNIIESHPTLPVLASAGLDYDFKIWSPIRPLYAEEDETFTHLKYSTTRINSDVQRLRKSKLAKAFFPNNDFINNNTTNNSNTEMESLRKLLSDKTNGISISIDSLTSSSSPSSPSSPSSLTSPSSCSISSTTSPSSSSSSSLSTSDEEMTSTTTNHHIDECDDIKNSKKQKQMPYEFINTSTEEYSVDMDSASSSSATAAVAAAVYTLSKSRKRRHPNTDMIFNEDIEAGDNIIAHNGDYCTEQNDEMLQVDNNNTNNIDHNDNNNNNTIKQEMNGISSEIINPQESPPLSKQPKRSSSQVLPTCSTSSTIPNNNNNSVEQFSNKQELIPCKIQENDDKTIKETAKKTVGYQDINNNNNNDNSKNGESQSNSDRIQPRIPQYFLPFNQIDLQLRVGQNWVNRALERSQLECLDDRSFRILTAIESVAELRPISINNTDDDDNSDSDSSNNNNSSSDSNNNITITNTNNNNADDDDGNGDNSSPDPFEFIQSVVRLNDHFDLPGNNRRRIRISRRTRTNNHDAVNNIEQRSEETLATRDREEGSDEHSSSDDEDFDNDNNNNNNSNNIASRISSFLANEFNCSSDSDSTFSSSSSSSSTPSSSSSSSSSAATSNPSSPSSGGGMLTGVPVSRRKFS